MRARAWITAVGMEDRESITDITELSRGPPGSEQGGERTQRSLNATQILSLCVTRVLLRH